jgi:hypothetical protein
MKILVRCSLPCSLHFAAEKGDQPPLKYSVIICSFTPVIIAISYSYGLMLSSIEALYKFVRGEELIRLFVRCLNAPPNSNFSTAMTYSRTIHVFYTAVDLPGFERHGMFC